MSTWDEKMSKMIDEDSEKIMERIILKNVKTPEQNAIIAARMKDIYKSSENSANVLFLSATPPLQSDNLTIEQLYEILVKKNN
jgi:hypothetical protein